MPFTDEDRTFLHLLVKDAVHEAMKEHLATDHAPDRIKVEALENRVREMEGQLKYAWGWAAGAGLGGGLVMALILKMLKLN